MMFLLLAACVVINSALVTSDCDFSKKLQAEEFSLQKYAGKWYVGYNKPGQPYNNKKCWSSNIDNSGLEENVAYLIKDGTKENIDRQLVIHNNVISASNVKGADEALSLFYPLAVDYNEYVILGRCLDNQPAYYIMFRDEKPTVEVEKEVEDKLEQLGEDLSTFTVNCPEGSHY